VKLFLKNSNLCDHNSPTSQTDRQTDRQTTCDRNTALCTKEHRAVKIDYKFSTVCEKMKKCQVPMTHTVYHLSTISSLSHLQKTTKLLLFRLSYPGIVLWITVSLCVVLVVAACYLGHLDRLIDLFILVRSAVIHCAWLRFVSLLPTPHQMLTVSACLCIPRPVVESRWRWLQVVQELVRRIPDGHQVKREVDFILNQISDTMTPMHYHIREVIFVTYNKVRRRLIAGSLSCANVCMSVCRVDMMTRQRGKFRSSCRTVLSLPLVSTL